MSERKIQVWFRPDQADLVVTMLRVCHTALAPYRQQSSDDNAGDAAKRYSRRRIDEVIGLFPAAPQTAPPK